MKRRHGHVYPPGPHEGYGELKTYVLGFVLSLVLTLASYFLVVEGILTGWNLIFTIGGFALVQAFVQLMFFLHLGSEPPPYWNFITFLFMIMVVLILVIGTLWIMYHLDYKMMGM